MYTPWFPLNIKPVRLGVYQIINHHASYAHYSYWNGKFWCFTTDSPAEAVQYKEKPSPSVGKMYNYYDQWRGLEKSNA